MDIVGMIIACLGILASIVSGIWLLVCAFKKSIVWGLLYLFIPFASLVYVIMDWQRAGKPFLVGVAGTIIMIVGCVISPTMQKSLTSNSSSSYNYNVDGTGSSSSSSSGTTTPEATTTTTTTATDK